MSWIDQDGRCSNCHAKLGEKPTDEVVAPVKAASTLGTVVARSKARLSNPRVLAAAKAYADLYERDPHASFEAKIAAALDAARAVS